MSRCNFLRTARKDRFVFVKRLLHTGHTSTHIIFFFRLLLRANVTSSGMLLRPVVHHIHTLMQHKQRKTNVNTAADQRTVCANAITSFPRPPYVPYHIHV